MVPPFGNDLYPALQTLSKFLEPHVKSLLLVALLLNPFPHLLPDWKSVVPAQAAQPLLILAFAYITGFLKLPNVDPSNSAWVYLAGPLLAFRTVSERIGIYFKVGLLMSLACYMPIYYGVPLYFQPWVYGLAFAIIFVIGFFAPTAKFYGPLRFGYLEYSEYYAKIYGLLLDWWVFSALFLVFSLVLLPFVGLGFVALSLSAWGYVYLEYNEQLREMTDEVATYVAQGAVTINSARQYATTTRHYEAQILEMAAATRRDALLAASVRTTDFFHVASEAWGAIGTVTQPVEDAKSKAAELVDASFDADEADKPGGEAGRAAVLSKYVYETATKALNKAKEVEAKLRDAQEAVRQSGEAKTVDENGRAAVKQNAKSAAAAARALANGIQGVPKDLLAVEKAASDANRYSKRAVAAAVNGEKASARKAADAAKSEIKTAVASMQTLKETMHGAHEILLEYLEKES